MSKVKRSLWLMCLVGVLLAMLVIPVSAQSNVLYDFGSNIDGVTNATVGQTTIERDTTKYNTAGGSLKVNLFGLDEYGSLVISVEGKGVVAGDVLTVTYFLPEGQVTGFLVNAYVADGTAGDPFYVKQADANQTGVWESLTWTIPDNLVGEATALSILFFHDESLTDTTIWIDSLVINADSTVDPTPTTGTPATSDESPTTGDMSVALYGIAAAIAAFGVKFGSRK